jgi:hypothetical protein
VSPRATSPTTEALAAALDADDRFHRDTGLGRIYHPGKLSYRELSPTDSLHIVIDGDHLSAHVDRVSPLKCRRDGSIGYSLPRILFHNLSGVGGHLARCVDRGRRPRRCDIQYELVELADGETANEAASEVAGEVAS